jgi:transposase
MRRFLSEEERRELKALHRCEKDRRSADRIKAVLLHDQGWPRKKIAKVLLLDEETISRHILDYRKHGKLRIESGGSDGLLSMEQMWELFAHLDAHTYTRADDIREHVRQEYGVCYTLSGMTAWLNKYGFSYKKPQPVPHKADPVQQEAFVKHYEDLQANTPLDEPILFMDGFHPTMATKVSYGWIRKDRDKPIGSTASRTRMNLVGTINLEDMKVMVQEYETINGEAIADYLFSLRRQFPNAPKVHVILDRGPYNVCEQAISAAKLHGIVLHHLPPYSPNLNAIERLWKVLNERVRNNRFFHSVQEFRTAIMEFFEVTWPEIAFDQIDRINDNFQMLRKSIVSS